MIHHPDRNSTTNKSQSEFKFKQIQQAYDVLIDPHKRHIYDTNPNNSKDDDNKDSDKSGFRYKGRDAEEVKKAPAVEKVVLCGLGELCRGVDKKMKISRTVVAASGGVTVYILPSTHPAPTRLGVVAVVIVTRNACFVIPFNMNEGRSRVRVPPGTFTPSGGIGGSTDGNSMVSMEKHEIRVKEEEMSGGNFNSVFLDFFSGKLERMVLISFTIYGPVIDCFDFFSGKVERVGFDQLENPLPYGDTGQGFDPHPLQGQRSSGQPPYLRKGTKVTFPEKGNQEPGIIAADLIFIIDEKPHEVFKREGNDLIINQEIPLLEALTGKTLDLTTLDGRNILIPVTEIVKPGYELIVPNEGMPISKEPRKKGNLIIKFDVSSLEEVDMTMQAMKQAIAMLQFHLKRSQNRIKSMADKHRSDRNFEVGMKVYLKLQPYRQSTVRQGTHHKFTAKYYGPFVIIAKVGKTNLAPMTPSFTPSMLAPSPPARAMEVGLGGRRRRRRNRHRLTNNEPELFGDDELPRPAGLHRIAKSQYSSNSTASFSSNPQMFQEMIQQQYELDRKEKIEHIDREVNSRVELNYSKKVTEDLKVLQISTDGMI
nr:DnaJ homolog subfamily B member 1 [Tanacetum cinerariifolium]